MTTPKLVIFDVDGTLVDSQAEIVAAMKAAFDYVGVVCPERPQILGIVGLSLGQAFEQLMPNHDQTIRDRAADAYRDAYFHHRQAGARPVVFDGVDMLLRQLAEQSDIILGIATGKSRRGLDALLDMFGWRDYFFTTQVSDDHTSKPSPSMIVAAMDHSGIFAPNVVMIGDTQFDMQMAQNAGVYGMGVSWGYHPVSQLTHAQKIVDHVHDIGPALSKIWRLKNG